MLLELGILSPDVGSALLGHNKKVKLAPGQALLVAGVGTALQI